MHRERVARVHWMCTTATSQPSCLFRHALTFTPLSEPGDGHGGGVVVVVIMVALVEVVDRVAGARRACFQKFEHTVEADGTAIDKQRRRRAINTVRR
jgi:hypothetical protein